MNEMLRSLPAAMFIAPHELPHNTVSAAETAQADLAAHERMYRKFTGSMRIAAFCFPLFVAFVVYWLT